MPAIIAELLHPCCGGAPCILDDPALPLMQYRSGRTTRPYLSQLECLPTYRHTRRWWIPLRSDAASATHGHKNIPRPCRGSNLSRPPVEILKLGKSSSRTEIIDRFILTTTLPTGHMESSLIYQCLKTLTRSEISITRPKFDKKRHTLQASNIQSLSD